MQEEKEKVGCKTLVRIEPNGEKVFKYKKKFETLDEAIEACKKLNSQPHRISKVVSYKCNSCHKFHVGRNGKQIKEKYRSKLIVELHKPTNEEIEEKKKRIRAIEIEHANFKIVGKIDLSKIPKK